MDRIWGSIALASASRAPRYFESVLLRRVVTSRKRWIYYLLWPRLVPWLLIGCRELVYVKRVSPRAFRDLCLLPCVYDFNKLGCGRERVVNAIAGLLRFGSSPHSLCPHFWSRYRRHCLVILLLRRVRSGLCSRPGMPVVHVFDQLFISREQCAEVQNFASGRC